MEQEKMRAAVCEDVLEEAQWLSDMIYKWYADDVDLQWNQHSAEKA